MKKKLHLWRKSLDKSQKKDNKTAIDPAAYLTIGSENATHACLDALSQVVTQEPVQIKKVLIFLKNAIGSDIVEELKSLNHDDQLQQCLEHLRIGLSVGDISEDDVWKLVQS